MEVPLLPSKCTHHCGYNHGHDDGCNDTYMYGYNHAYDDSYTDGYHDGYPFSLKISPPGYKKRCAQNGNDKEKEARTF